MESLRPRLGVSHLATLEIVLTFLAHPFQSDFQDPENPSSLCEDHEVHERFMPKAVKLANFPSGLCGFAAGQRTWTNSNLDMVSPRRSLDLMTSRVHRALVQYLKSSFHADCLRGNTPICRIIPVLKGSPPAFTIICRFKGRWRGKRQNDATAGGNAPAGSLAWERAMTGRLIMRWLDYTEDDDGLYAGGVAVLGARVVIVVLRCP